jgi:hypothetical protein
MKRPALRFSICNGTDRRAATWKLWTEAGKGESEIYLVCRELGGILKASLHKSGKWHVAYEDSAFEKYVSGISPNLRDRYIDKWYRPSEFTLGVTMAFRIVTPWSSVTSLIWCRGGWLKGDM